MKNQKINFYSLGSIISVASIGLLHGFDLITIKLLYFFDSFRILFKLDTWDGTGRNVFGTPFSMLNIDIPNNQKRVDDFDYFNSTKTIYNDNDNDSYHDDNYSFRNLKQTDNEDFIEAMITFGYVFGAIFGAYIISLFTEKKGRKKLILISTITYSLGSFIIASSFRITNIPIIITLGRFIIGMSIGALSVVCPIYISELAPTNYRGLYIYIYHIFMIIGFILSGTISIMSFEHNNYFPLDINKPRPKIDEPINNFDWKILYIIQGIIGLIYLLIIYKTPESPRWLCFNERYLKALTIFNKLNGYEIAESKSTKKYEAIKDDAIFNRSIGNTKYSELWIPGIRRFTLIIFLLYYFQQWSGYLIYNYLENQAMTKSYDIITDTLTIPIIHISIVILIISFFLIFCIELFGRKPLLIFGTLLLILVNCSSIIYGSFNININKSLVSGPLFYDSRECTNDMVKNTVSFYAVEKTSFYKDFCHENIHYCTNAKEWLSWDGIQITENNYAETITDACEKLESDIGASNFYMSNYIALAFIVIFMCIWEPIPLIYQTEIFPMRIRDKGSAIGIISKYINQGLIIFVGPRLISSKGKYGMIPFVIFTCFALLFIISICPETKKIELEDIESKLLNNNDDIVNDEALENLTITKNKAKYQRQKDEEKRNIEIEEKI